MSQGVIPMSAGGGGGSVRAKINAALQRLQTKGSGTARPSDIGTFEDWIDTDTPGGGIASWYLYDGASDILLGYINTTTHAFTPASGSGLSTPQGRLTLASATPVMISAQLAKTTVYYALYCGNQIPIYDGSAFAMTTFAELSNDLTQSSTGKAGPAAATTNSNYDLFVWSDSGTLRLTRGPAWSSDTGRGTGAGTTELERKLGLWTNKVAITNGPGANLGTYVGTIRTDGSSQANWQPGGSAAGGTAALLNVWNAYNRVNVAGHVFDSADSWNYSTATWRSADNSAGLRASFVQGLQEDVFEAAYTAMFSTSGGGTGLAGVGLNSTTVASGVRAQVYSGTTGNVAIASNLASQVLGFNYMQALEAYSGGGTATWYGDFGGSDVQSGLTYRGRF